MTNGVYIYELRQKSESSSSDEALQLKEHQNANHGKETTKMLYTATTIKIIQDKMQ